MDQWRVEGFFCSNIDFLDKNGVRVSILIQRLDLSSSCILRSQMKQADGLESGKEEFLEVLELMSFTTRRNYSYYSLEECLGSHKYLLLI